jgi:hypothetical protein
METIRKAGTIATYFKGNFYLRDSNKNWACPIEFPTVFVAYGKGIKNGNWQSCTSINTPKFVIDYYFKGVTGKLKNFWDYVYLLEVITWNDVENDKQKVLTLINLANNELIKLSEI